MSSSLKKQADVIALFALMLGAAGFFNTFDLSSGKIAPVTACSSVNGKCNTTYCGTKTSPAATNCADEYCLVGSSPTPCLATNCVSIGQRTGTFTTTSTSFVTVQASADVTNCATTPSPSPVFLCLATFNFRTNSLTGSASFQIFNGGVASSTYQFDDTGQALISSDMLGSISWADTSAQQFSTWSLQAKVSAITITLTVLKADIQCFGATGTVG